MLAHHEEKKMTTTTNRNPRTRPPTMDEITLRSLQTLVSDHHEQWTSNNIFITVFPSLDSDGTLDIDVCTTLRGPERGDLAHSSKAKTFAVDESPFQVC